ncbi:MAG: rRNA maturation RNase YbeY [Planctomycetota bacterium]|nr:rRNA maturation RNase YbeY [Planctomycetota bacterium]
MSELNDQREMDEPDSSSDSEIPPEQSGPIDHEPFVGIEVVASDTLACESVDLDWIREWLQRAAEHQGSAIERLSIRVYENEAMAHLHEQFGGPATPTDVLTFPMHDGTPIEADIAICIDVAREKAAEQGHTVERELLLYALHGLLHCVGFDDHAESDYATMHAEEDRILEAIGIGALFKPLGGDDS